MTKVQASHLTGQCKWAKHKPIFTSRKRGQNGLIRNVLSFSVCEVFAIAKVKLHREPPKLMLRFGEPRFSEVCAMHK